MSKEHMAAVIGDHTRSGVYYLPRSSATDLFAAAQARHLALFRVELGGIDNKEGFLAAVARTLGFPAWFGDNWDALEDCLTDLSWIADVKGYVVLLDNADRFSTTDEPGFLTALSIFRSAADYWSEHGLPFWALATMRSAGVAMLPELP
jgi:hypothetical protein